MLIRASSSNGGGSSVEAKNYYMINGASGREMGEYIFGTELTSPASSRSTAQVIFTVPQNISATSNSSSLTLFGADGTVNRVGTSGGTMNNCIGVAVCQGSACKMTVNKL